MSCQKGTQVQFKLTNEVEVHLFLFIQEVTCNLVILLNVPWDPWSQFVCRFAYDDTLPFFSFVFFIPPFKVYIFKWKCMLLMNAIKEDIIFMMFNSFLLFEEKTILRLIYNRIIITDNKESYSITIQYIYVWHVFKYSSWIIKLKWPTSYRAGIN